MPADRDLIEVKLTDIRPNAEHSRDILALEPRLELKTTQSLDAAFTLSIDIYNSGPTETIILNPLDSLSLSVFRNGVDLSLKPDLQRILGHSGSGKFPPRPFNVVEMTSAGQSVTQQDAEAARIRVLPKSHYRVKFQIDRIKKDPKDPTSQEWLKVSPGDYELRVWFLVGTRSFASERFNVSVPNK